MKSLAAFMQGFGAGFILVGGAVYLLTPLSGTELRQVLQARWQTILESSQQAAELRRQDLQAQLSSQIGHPAMREVTAPAQSDALS